jgi:hypothetical protein
MPANHVRTVRGAQISNPIRNRQQCGAVRMHLKSRIPSFVVVRSVLTSEQIRAGLCMRGSICIRRPSRLHTVPSDLMHTLGAPDVD